MTVELEAEEEIHRYVQDKVYIQDKGRSVLILLCPELSSPELILS